MEVPAATLAAVLRTRIFNSISRTDTEYAVDFIMMAFSDYS